MLFITARPFHVSIGFALGKCPHWSSWRLGISGRKTRGASAELHPCQTAGADLH
jgi:hypothetical protein